MSQTDVNSIIGNIWLVGSCNQPDTIYAGIMLAIGIANIAFSIWQRNSK